MNVDIIENLKRCSLCQGMDEEQIKYIIKGSNSNIRTYEKNEFIFLEDDTPAKIYILLQGRINIAEDTCGGKRTLITNIEKPGDTFGEVYVFIEEKKYNMHAQSSTKSIVLELSKEIFLPFYESEELNKEIVIHRAESILQQNLLKIFAKKAIIMNKKLKVLGSSSIREKICKYLIDLQNRDGLITQNLSREDMADYLNVTRPSVSRELGKMQEENIIKIDGRKIIITDQELLEKFIL